MNRGSKSLACLQRYSKPLAHLLSLMEKANKQRQRGMLADLILQKEMACSHSYDDRYVSGPPLTSDQASALSWFQILFSSSPAPGTVNNPVLELDSTTCVIKGTSTMNKEGQRSVDHSSEHMVDAHHWRHIDEIKWCISKNVCCTGNRLNDFA